MIKAKQIIKLSEGDDDYLQKIKDLVYKHGYRQAPSSLVWTHHDEICLGAKVIEITFSKKTIKDLQTFGFVRGFDDLYKKVCHIVGAMNITELQPSRDHDSFDVSCGNKGQFFPARVNFTFKVDKRQTDSRLIGSVYVNTKKLEDLNQLPPKVIESFWRDFSTTFPFMIDRVKDAVNDVVKFNK